MSDPRSSELGDLLLTLTGLVREDRAQGIDANVVFHVPGDSWTIRFVHGRMTVGRGAAERPDTSVWAEAATLVAINSGLLSGVDAFLDGRIAVRGNLGLALRLESLFDPPVPRPAGAFVDEVVRAGDHDASIIAGGSGDPVLLIHGLGATKASLLSTARALAGRYRVVAPDLLGHGDSAKPRGSYDAAFHARFIVDLMDTMGIERAHLVGNSLGGRVSIEVALRHPDRVGSIALLCPAVALVKGRGMIPAVRWLRPELAALPARLPHALVVRGIRQLFSKPERLPRSWYTAGADEFLRCWRDVHTRIALTASLRSILFDHPWGPDGFWPRLGRLERPALFVWGERDRLVSAAFSRRVQRVLPDAESIVLEDCGHVPQFELPEPTHAHLGEFLARTA